MVSLLSDLYPSTLDKWATRQDPPGYAVDDSGHVAVLNVALQMNISSILPMVMYEICIGLHDLDEIFFSTGEYQIMDPDFRRRCILGYSRLQSEQRDILRYVRRAEGIEKCETTLKCDSERLRWMGLALGKNDMNPLADDNRDSWNDFNCCSACRKTAKETYHVYRERLWDYLPTIFGFENWDVLLGNRDSNTVAHCSS
ncbi:hypothetical protein MVEN_00190500 [Mycena venus]|uniref:Uncharacterized protein n=1 Tax=Mycena venus TaxID=2733690 RepID=A0A8H6Z0Z6_9AGAR|nr:hypothetical protein MVEN_00190500 [Mycena venus]